METWIDIIGWLGALSVLIAYAMVSTRKWEGDSRQYQGLNLLGGICLIVNTIYFGAYPSSFVNFVWVGIAIFSLNQARSKV